MKICLSYCNLPVYIVNSSCFFVRYLPAVPVFFRAPHSHYSLTEYRRPWLWPLRGGLLRGNRPRSPREVGRRRGLRGRHRQCLFGEGENRLAGRDTAPPAPSRTATWSPRLSDPAEDKERTGRGQTRSKSTRSKSTRQEGAGRPMAAECAVTESVARSRASLPVVRAASWINPLGSHTLVAVFAFVFKLSRFREKRRSPAPTPPPLGCPGVQSVMQPARAAER